jgi:putative IMPACT (imprinted ancient) family translation regulator
LTRAYGQAVSEAAKLAQLTQVETMCERRATLPFAEESTLRRLCEQHGVAVLDAQYGEAVTLLLRMKASQAEAFCSEATNLLRGNVAIEAV